MKSFGQKASTKINLHFKNLFRLATHSKFLVLIFFIISSTAAHASGIRGNIKDDLGNPLAYATIYVKQTGSGSTTNADGNYEIVLAPGRYDLVFQYVGYETQVLVVNVNSDFEVVNVILKSQTTVLQTVIIKGGKEDPAYTIMRKAIAKANYHTQQLDSYSGRVYIKGVGKLKDYPWLAKKALEKEGIKKNSVFVTESVSEIKYTRPNKIEEKVISIRSDGKDNNTSPNQYIFGSFYEPEIAETISPLSPRAFSYYRFEYQGTFKDREYEVSRIKVTPRSKGDNVVEGMLYLVEDWWSIHSFDFHTTKLGIGIQLKSVCAPIEEKVWLPVTHQFKIDGKFFGFDFEYNYFATTSDYKITLNPEVYVEVEKMEVIDEKVDLIEAKKITEQFKSKRKDDKNQQLQERLASGKEITNKELKTLVKEYEKQELKQQKDPEVVENVSFKIDSGAYKKDSSYWSNIRPIPLTKEEVKGYEKIDSLSVVERKKESGDTLKVSKHKGFQPWDILIGDSYKTGKYSNFKIHMPFGGFNTVEGWNLIYKLSWGTILQDTNKTRLTISPTFRYAFSREVFSGHLNFKLRNKKYSFEAVGGRYIKQYNPDEPILPIVNGFTTLFMEKNLMKLYEREYVDLFFSRNINSFLTIRTTASWAQRRELFNNSNFKLINWKSVEGYTDNRPVNDEINSTQFPTHQAMIASVGITARPWLKYKIRNDRKMEIPNSSPTFSFDYRKGFKSVLGSDVDFDQIEIGVRHQFSLGVRGKLDFNLRGGMFVNSNKIYFMDYKHFLGNQTPFVITDPVGTFRLLDYYTYSTADKYFSANVHYQFRKFLLTNIMLVRMAGIRENIFVNYLATPTSKNYTEVGYSIDGILRIFRLEAAASFQNGEYLNYGFRIGIASNLSVNFSDN